MYWVKNLRVVAKHSDNIFFDTNKFRLRIDGLDPEN